MTTPDTFSAADSALGYLYQVRAALLWSLRRLKGGAEFLVSIEALDDVAFETTGGQASDLLQTKHHLNRAANLANASPDLWKTLRVWFETHEAGALASGATLQLITTAATSPGSAAAYLLSEGRDVAAALTALETTASTSASRENAAAYQAFLKPSQSVRKALLDRVVVIDSAPNVTAVGEELKQEIYWAVERQHVDAFLDRLEGWWLRRALAQLVATASGQHKPLLSAELEAQFSDLREQFKQDSLPIDDDLLSFELDEATHAAHASSTFVHQLNLAVAAKKRVVAAIRDYYRAFEQRSRWVRDDLLFVGDLTSYESRLVEEWELVFAQVTDEVGADAAEEAKQKAAREVLKWAEGVSLPIRPNVTEPFVTRGSLHMLADHLRLGWHPDFRDRLAQLLAVPAQVGA